MHRDIDICETELSLIRSKSIRWTNNAVIFISIINIIKKADSIFQKNIVALHKRVHYIL